MRMADHPFILGIDIGGTKVALARVSEDGQLLSQTRFPFHSAPVKQFPQILSEHIAAFLQGATPLGIGIGLKGMIAADHRTILHSSILDGLLPFDLCAALSQSFDAPCSIDNDVHAATLAEIHFGAGRVHNDFVFINLGTGMAVGMVASGRLVRGARNLAGELGTCIDLRAVCGEEYRLETLVSGEGMALEAARLLGQHPYSLLSQRIAVGGITGRGVLIAHRVGDPLALEAVDNLLEALSRMLCNLTLLLDPSLFVFGGGVVSDGYLLSLLRARVEKRWLALDIGAWSANVALSALGSDAIAVLGAASVYLSNRGALTRKE